MMKEEIQKIIKLVAIYARVSTARQEEEETIKAQILALREFCEKKGYIIVEEYIDDGWSGDMLVRPELDRLREDAKKKIWEAALIYDPDRLARRYSYQELVMDELREAGIEVIFLTTPAPKNPEEKVMYGMRGIFSEWERLKISERFRIGKLRKVKEGHVLISEPPYGYSYISRHEKAHGYYEINEKEALVVRKVFIWIGNKGLTIRQTIKKLQDLKIAPRKSKRGVWSTSTLQHLLRNRTYIGEATYGSSYAVVPENPLKKEKYRKMKKTSRKKKPEEEWIKIQVPSILEKELFERTQRQLRKNFELSKRNKKNNYLLSRLIRHSCGSTMAGEGVKGGKNIYYRCTDRISRFPLPPQCKGSINGKILDEIVWEKIQGLMSSPELLQEQLSQWVEHEDAKPDPETLGVNSMKIEADKLIKEEERYNRAYGAGVIGLEQLSNYTREIRAKISRFTQEINQIEQKKNGRERLNLPRTSEEIEIFVSNVKEVLNNLNFEEKRAIVVNVIERVVVNNEGKVEIEGYIPIPSSNMSRSVLSIGIVGLPNVGKSTLFKALTKQEITIANYPFATIDPNVGVVTVPDERLQKLADISHSKKIVPAVVEFYDIAGLVKGANKGEGLGNKFLSHIRETQAIVIVIRIFGNSEIIHVEGNVNPLRDLEIINAELILKDLETIEKRLKSLEGEKRTGDKKAAKNFEILDKIREELGAGNLAVNYLSKLNPSTGSTSSPQADAQGSAIAEEIVKELQLLTAKKQVYLLNGGEFEAPHELLDKIKEIGADYVIADLSGIKHTNKLENVGMSSLIKKAYEVLGLISFLTTGEDETRAWTIEKGSLAPQAAGAIHTDFEKNFIRAEVVNWQKLVEAGGWVQAKQKGLVRVEGKEYEVKDGDVIVVRHG